MQFIVEQGNEAERLRLSQSGPFQPTTSAENAELQLQNERVEVFVLREFVAPTSGIEKPSPDEDMPDESDADHHADAHGHGDEHAMPSAHANEDHASIAPAARTLAADHEASH
jgi:hypothetical protein